MISKDGHLIFFDREYVNNKLCKLDRGTIDSFDSYKCVHIFIFISNFHSIITRMGLYHAINLSCVAYIKRYTVKVVIYAGTVVKYAFSGVQQYAWVLNTQMHDLPHLSFDSFSTFAVRYHFKKSLSFLNIFHIWMSWQLLVYVSMATATNSLSACWCLVGVP